MAVRNDTPPGHTPFLRRYQTRSRRSFEEALRRGSKYLPAMEAILAAEGVPIELVYLPIVESSFRLDAASWAGAVGPWQFLRATGRHYGLRIDDCVDERRDPERSTRAAARYLRYLYGRFGDWHLSLAAYNGGEAKIADIRRRKKVKDFWEMSGRGYLPKETSRFVPRFLAVMELATSPQQYGLTVAPGAPDRYEWITVDRPITVNTVAELSHTSVSSIRDLNPALRCGVVPKRYPMRIPNGNRHRFELAYSQWILQPGAANGTHRVSRGENPGSIARHYGVSVTDLMEFNHIGNPRTLQIDTVLKIPDHSVKRIAPKGPAI